MLACSCGPGRELVGRTCKDVDECLWQPCLHGGSCYNMQPGFLCVCGPGHSGHYCQWTNLDSPPYHLKGTMTVVTLALSTIFVGECGTAGTILGWLGCCGVCSCE